jgi:hypothetical protein
MGFAERAVNAFVKAATEGRADERLAQDVLKCKKVDVSPIEPFLTSRDLGIRYMAVKIIGARGNEKVLLNTALNENDPFLLEEMLKWLGKRKAEGIEELNRLLQSEDTRVKEATIQMFRRANKTDQLFAMLFDKDDNTVNRIKRYFDEQEKQVG